MKSILKDISLYSMGVILTKGISFLSIIIYTYFLTKEEIGVYGYILIVISFANIFFLLGAENAYARYFFDLKTEQEKKVLTSTLFLFLFVWLLLISLIALFFVKDISKLLLDTQEYQFVFFVAFLSLPFRLLFTMSNQALRNQFKTKEFVLFNFLVSCISIITVIILLYYTKLGIASIFISMIVADFLVFPMMIYFIKNLFVFEFDFALLKKVLLYGIPFVPTAIGYWIFSSSDRVMLEKMVDLESVGVYTIASSIAMVMTLVSTAVGQGWGNHALKAYEDNPVEAKKLYIRFFNLVVYLSLVVIVSIALTGKEIIAFMLPSTYGDIFYPMIFLLIGIAFQLTTQVTVLGMSLMKKSIYLIYITFFIAIFNISMNYFLIPVFQEVGASIATMCSFFLLTIIYAVITQKLYKLDYDFKVILFALIVIVLSIGFSFSHELLRWLLFSGMLIVIYYNKNKIKKGIA